MFTICHLLCIFQKDYWEFCVTVTGVLLTLALLADQVYARELFWAKQENEPLPSLTQSGSSHSPLYPLAEWQAALHCSNTAGGPRSIATFLIFHKRPDSKYSPIVLTRKWSACPHCALSLCRLKTSGTLSYQMRDLPSWGLYICPGLDTLRDTETNGLFSFCNTGYF